MIKASTMRWYSLVGGMVWAGAIWRQIVPFHLSQHIGGYGRGAPNKDVFQVRFWSKADIGLCVAHGSF